MTIQDLHIISIKKIEDTGINGSSTGYCKYTKIKITYENGMTSEVWIPNWYNSKEMQWQELKLHFSSMLNEGYYVIVNQENIDMFFKSLME